MTFEAFNAHLTQIICPFRVSPSPPLFRLYFSLEIYNPCSEELLTLWTCVVLVNAAIEVSRLVKTCAFAQQWSCGEWGVQAQSFLRVCVQGEGEGQAARQRLSTSLLARAEGFSWNFYGGGVGVIKSTEFFFSSKQ